MTPEKEKCEMKHLNKVSTNNRPKGYNDPTMTTHTPTPLEAKYSSAREAYNVQEIKGPIILGVIWNKDDADYIVHAVNAHEEIVRLLGLCHNWISDHSPNSIDEPLAHQVYAAMLKARGK